MKIFYVVVAFSLFFFTYHINHIKLLTLFLFLFLMGELVLVIRADNDIQLGSMQASNLFVGPYLLPARKNPQGINPTHASIFSGP